MPSRLQNKKIAILATHGVEQSELLEPRKVLEAEGAKPVVISPEKDKIKSWSEKHWGQEISVDLLLDSAHASDFDALVLPGGVMNPDNLRMQPKAVDFVRQFFAEGKPVAAICHGPWMLVEAGAVKGRTLTSWPSLQTDIRNAGGQWVDREVVSDNGLVTSRKPADIPAFNEKMIEAFEGAGQIRAKSA